MSFLLHRFPIHSVYDIGASIGYFSYLAASIKGIKPAVHAFELHPGAVEQFEQFARPLLIVTASFIFTTPACRTTMPANRPCGTA